MRILDRPGRLIPLSIVLAVLAVVASGVPVIGSLSSLAVLTLFVRAALLAVRQTVHGLSGPETWLLTTGVVAVSLLGIGLILAAMSQVHIAGWIVGMTDVIVLVAAVIPPRRTEAQPWPIRRAAGRLRGDPHSLRWLAATSVLGILAIVLSVVSARREATTPYSELWALPVPLQAEQPARPPVAIGVRNSEPGPTSYDVDLVEGRTVKQHWVIRLEPGQEWSVTTSTRHATAVAIQLRKSGENTVYRAVTLSGQTRVAALRAETAAP